MLKVIRNILILITLLGLSTLIIDFKRLKDNKSPIFNITSYNEIKHIQNYRGLFYQASRKTKVSDKEPIKDSSEIYFYILTKKINITNKKNSIKEESMIVELENNISCNDNSILYYADLDIKIYTYCINKIDITMNNKKDSLLNFLKKDNNLINTLLDKISYTGLINSTTEIYKTVNLESESNFKVFKCNQEGINDVYITPKNANIQSDFCTYKDDDLKFIFEIEEITSTEEQSKQEEVFYEDENYIYKFNEQKSENIYITTPKVRLSEEKRIPLKEVLYEKILTIDDLEKKGLKFEKIPKTQ